MVRDPGGSMGAFVTAFVGGVVAVCLAVLRAQP